MAGINFLQVATADTGNLSSYSFASQNLGTAAPDRYVLCAVHSSSTGTTARNITGLTIAGVTASKVVETTGSATNLTLTALWIALVPTGTSGTVAVTFNNTMQRCQIALYNFSGMVGVASNTLTVTTNNQNNSIICPDRAWVVSASTVNANSTVTLSNVTEKYDATMETNASAYGGGTNGAFTPPGGVNTNANWVTGTEISAVHACWGESKGGGLLLQGCGA